MDNYTVYQQIDKINHLIELGYYDNAENSLRTLTEHLIHWLLWDNGLWKQACTKDGKTYHTPFLFRGIPLLYQKKIIDAPTRNVFESIRTFGNVGSHSINGKKEDMVYLTKKIQDYLPEFLEKCPHAENMSNHPNKKDTVKSSTKKKSSKSSNFGEDVTAEFHRQHVRFVSCVASHFASARFDNENNPVRCDIETPDAWETFEAELAPDGWIYFKSCRGNYLSVRLDIDSENPPLCATASEPQAWEMFKIFRFENAYCLQAQNNKKFLSCRMDLDNAPITVSCDKADYWEKFEIQKV